MDQVWPLGPREEETEQSPASRETQVASGHQSTVAAIDAANAADPGHRLEQRTLLLIGFSTGLLVAGIFLVYIVLAQANTLP